MIAGIASGAGLWSPINIVTAHVSKDRQPSPCACIFEATSEINLPPRGNHRIFLRGFGWGKGLTLPGCPCTEAKGSKEPRGASSHPGSWASGIVSTIVYADVLKKTTNTKARFILKLVFMQDGF